MGYVQLKKTDYLTLMKNVLVISNMYPSGNRRAYISQLGLLYSSNKIPLEEIQKGAAYFKILRATVTEDISNENVERLTEVITILEKYDRA